MVSAARPWPATAIQDPAAPHRRPTLPRAGQGSSADVRSAYLRRIVGDVTLARPMKIVIDCGNGVAGGIAPELFRSLGCEVVELFCEVDGTFPNHHPDPSKPENLQDLIRALRDHRRRTRPRFRRRRRPPRRGDQGRRDHLPGSPADALRRRRAARCPGGQIIYDVKCTRRWRPGSANMAANR
jgi:phosphomannomutase/phosphoglucomutase